ncbi:hypothetical protein PU560_07175 [Georgenia sp. 10Sc9-8]|uniref:Uncharacterized protein n=1 Tax=Georgenia halotolerans TaxID=3028317 RepID=A0ABT5TW14_9MICO|nr:hypothetical protein [Georgenia halotolerans]
MTRRRPRPLALVTAVVLVLITAPGIAWGLWSHQTQLTTAATAGVVQSPTNLECDTERGLLGLLAPYVHLSWQAPIDTDAAHYRVLISDGTNTDVLATTAETSTDITVGLLSDGVIGWLGSVLGIGGQADITIETAHPSGWSSAPVGPQTIRLSLTGVECA